MSDPTARALQLLELLQSAHQRGVRELSERLGVDERTVRRDVARLADLGVRIESVRGRYGGYRLAPGQHAVPIAFSAEELVALHTGLAHALADPSTPDVSLHTALAKIRRSVRREDEQSIDSVLRLIPDHVDRPLNIPEPAVILAVAESIRRRNVLDLRYRNREGTPSRRKVHPYRIDRHAGRWYLVAFDTAVGEERIFRLDRIDSARVVSQAFQPSHSVSDVSLADRFAAAGYRWTAVLRIRAAEANIRSHLPASIARLEVLDQTSDESGAPWHRAEIHAERLDWLPPIIAALDGDVIVDSPEELHDLVRATAKKMLDSI
ncbi:helix-turn-helix transcriptional regulator [Microbacterium halotolerans]|uniref:helix-turn-helix transcriptional regulator n=1 Tax=Microbacterium halotolerans TaxID=246613 RepID=UPI000E6AD507|nr:WYL domain-containing protein [Microbacterium halotolerans]